MTVRVIKIAGALMVVGSLVALLAIELDWAFQYRGVGFRMYVAMTPLTVTALGALVYAVGELIAVMQRRYPDAETLP